MISLWWVVLEFMGVGHRASGSDVELALHQCGLGPMAWGFKEGEEEHELTPRLQTPRP